MWPDRERTIDLVTGHQFCCKLGFPNVGEILEIVHNSFHQKYYRNWISVMMISLAWMTGFAFSLPAAFANMIFLDGICSPMNFPSYLDALIFSGSVVLVAYVIPVLVFVVCYGHILVTMKASFKNFDNPWRR